MPLRTTGQLRAFLLKAIDAVSTGDLEPNRAHAITKLAAQISASMMAEIEVARIALKDNQKVNKFGELEIASEISDSRTTTIEARIATTLPAKVNGVRGDPMPYPGDPPLSRSALSGRI